MALKTYLGQPIPLLAAADEAGAGDVHAVTWGFYRHVVQVKKAGSAGPFSVTVEGSLNGTDWFAAGAAQTADGLLQFTGVYRYVRANLTAVTPGDTVTVTYDAH